MDFREREDYNDNVHVVKFFQSLKNFTMLLLYLSHLHWKFRCFEFKMRKNINTRGVNKSIRNNSEISRRKDGLNRVNTLAGILRGRQSARKAQRLLWAPQGSRHLPPPPWSACRAGTMWSHPSPVSIALLAGAKWARLPPVQLSSERSPHNVPLCSGFKLAFNLETWILQHFSSSKRALLLIWRSLFPSSNLGIWTLDQLTKFWVDSKQAWFFSLCFPSCPPKSLLRRSAGGVSWKCTSGRATTLASRGTSQEHFLVLFTSVYHRG